MLTLSNTYTKMAGGKISHFKRFSLIKYDFMQQMNERFQESFGMLVTNFIMIVWGQSGQGKTNFIMQVIKFLQPYGKVLYVSLEEGLEASMQLNAIRHFSNNEHSGNLYFADHTMSYELLCEKLAKKKSPRFIVIDSVQYWGIDYTQYKLMKEKFPKKSFIFISHASGKLPDGKTADKIRYDAGIKVRVEGYVAFVISRYGGNKPFVIWEDGAKKYWGKQFKKITLTEK